MEVNIAEGQKAAKSRKAELFRFLAGLYILTYLTSDTKGLPGPADVIRLSLHILQRAVGIFEVLERMFGSLNL